MLAVTRGENAEPGGEIGKPPSDFNREIHEIREKGFNRRSGGSSQREGELKVES